MLNRVTKIAKRYILKLQGLTYPTFKTNIFKTRENYSDAKSYFIILFIIGLAISIFYYFYLKYQGGAYFTHYYEYYTRAVVISDALKNLDFFTAARYYLESYVDKILIFRSVPFLLLFGYSHFVFFYSNIFFNLFLLLILFHSLLKIMQPEKAFSLTLFILSQYFFIELLTSFYVDLSFFIICSIFFIYLSLFDKNPEKYNIRLSFIVFLLFLIKNVSYPLVPIISVLFIIYFFISKNNRMVYILRFSIIVTAGFFIYCLGALGGSSRLLIDDLHATMSTISQLESTQPLISAVSTIFKAFGLFINTSFINKFPFSGYNLIIYPVVIFVTYKKRDTFWFFLFCASELFFIFFYNIKGHFHEYRYFLPFYFVYLYFAYEFAIILFNKIFTKKWLNTLLLLFSLTFLLTSFMRLEDPKRRCLYSCESYKVDYFSRYFPLRSKLYISDNIPDYFYFYESFIDRDKKDYSYLAKVEPRFKYKIVPRSENADYIIGKDTLELDYKKHELITTMGEYYLLKKK